MKFPYRKNKKPQISDVRCAICKRHLTTDELLHSNLCTPCTIEQKTGYERKNKSHEQ